MGTIDNFVTAIITNSATNSTITSTFVDKYFIASKFVDISDANLTASLPIPKKSEPVIKKLSLSDNVDYLNPSTDFLKKSKSSKIN